MTGQLRPGQLWPALLAEAWAALSGESGDAGDTRLPAGLEVLWVSGAPGNLPSQLPAQTVLGIVFIAFVVFARQGLVGAVRRAVRA